MDYYLMDPPFGSKPFREMSKKEAKIHFDWYVSEIPNRIQMLKDAFEFDGGNPRLLDLTPKSLILLWQWFIPQVSTVSKTQEELEAEMRKVPDWLKEEVARNTQKLSIGTLAIAMDIAIYFAEVFVNHYENVNWGLLLKPKNHAEYHQPVLFGFGKKEEMNPRGVIYTLTLRAVRGETESDSLYEMYRIWEEFIPKTTIS